MLPTLDWNIAQTFSQSAARLRNVVLGSILPLQPMMEVEAALACRLFHMEVPFFPLERYAVTSRSSLMTQPWMENNINNHKGNKEGSWHIFK